jgi:hypothetical protein
MYNSLDYYDLYELQEYIDNADYDDEYYENEEKYFSEE